MTKIFKVFKYSLLISCLSISAYATQDQDFYKDSLNQSSSKQHKKRPYEENTNNQDNPAKKQKVDQIELQQSCSHELISSIDRLLGLDDPNDPMSFTENSSLNWNLEWNSNDPFQENFDEQSLISSIDDNLNNLIQQLTTVEQQVNTLLVSTTIRQTPYETQQSSQIKPNKLKEAENAIQSIKDKAKSNKDYLSAGLELAELFDSYYSSHSKGRQYIRNTIYRFGSSNEEENNITGYTLVALAEQYAKKLKDKEVVKDPFLSILQGLAINKTDTYIQDRMRELGGIVYGDFLFNNHKVIKENKIQLKFLYGKNPFTMYTYNRLFWLCYQNKEVFENLFEKVSNDKRYPFKNVSQLFKKLSEPRNITPTIRSILLYRLMRQRTLFPWNIQEIGHALDLGQKFVNIASLKQNLDKHCLEVEELKKGMFKDIIEKVEYENKEPSGPLERLKNYFSEQLETIRDTLDCLTYIFRDQEISFLFPYFYNGFKPADNKKEKWTKEEAAETAIFKTLDDMLKDQERPFLKKALLLSHQDIKQQSNLFKKVSEKIYTDVEFDIEFNKSDA